MSTRFGQIIIKDIGKLREEISLFKNDADLWKLTGGIKNTPGNLCLHICGNLKHYLGEALGNTGFKRDRDSEFTKKGISKEELLKEIDETAGVISRCLNTLNEEKLGEKYPRDYYGDNITVGHALVITALHFNYHLGQINYHRRII